MYVGLILSIRTITACPALLVNLTLTVVPKTDHKLYDYLPTSAYVGQMSITIALSGYIICVVQMLSQVTIFA